MLISEDNMFDEKHQLKNPGLLFYLSLFWLSASVLFYEFLLMRFLSLMVWTPFVHIIISVAMLGFGVSGSCLWLLGKIVNKYHVNFIAVVTFTFAVVSVACLFISQTINFNAFMMLWDYRQYLIFLLLAFIFFLPFLLGAMGLGAYFMINQSHIGKTYFFNLMGSAAGVILLMLALEYLSPENLHLSFLFMCTVGLFCLAYSYEIKLPINKFAFCSVLLLSFALFNTRLNINYSEYKSFSRIMHMPDSKVIDQKTSILGSLQAVRSPAFHHLPGVSLCYDGTPPEQIALFLDGELLGAVDINADRNSKSYMDFTPSNLVYKNLNNPHVLIIGAQGGSEIQQALSNNARKIDLIEVNNKLIQTVNLLATPDQIYSNPKVNIISETPRNAIKRSHTKYDAIFYPACGSEASTVASMSALNENYLFTTDAVVDFLKHLNDNGLLFLSSWIQYPPKEGIKLIALAVEALEQFGVGEPESHIFAFRSWNMFTIVLSPKPFNESFYANAKLFLDDMSFDAVFYKGVNPNETNVFNLMEDNPYHNAAMKILSPERDDFYRQSLFNIRPPSDDKPFFGNFLKWGAIPRLFRSMKADWIPFMDWGQLLTVIALLHALLIGFGLIFLPLIFARTGFATRTKSIPRLIIYFSSLGIAFFLLEIGFIQRFSLVLVHPTYSSFIVVVLFLIGAGLGSMAYQNLKNRIFNNPWRFFLPILLLLCVYAFGLERFLHLALGFSLTLNIIFAAIIILLISFFMGMAFPSGLENLSEQSPNLIPWAWGVNAYSSVVAGTVIPLIAQNGGFFIIMVLAGFFYFLAGLTLKK